MIWLAFYIALSVIIGAVAACKPMFEYYHWWEPLVTALVFAIIWPVLLLIFAFMLFM